MAAAIARFLPRDDEGRTALDRFARPVLRNWNRSLIGALKPAPALFAC